LPFEPTSPLFGAPVGVTPLELRLDFWHQKTRDPGLSYGLFAWFYIQPFWYNTGVWWTDGQTNKQTHDDSIYHASIVSRGKNGKMHYFGETTVW